MLTLKKKKKNLIPSIHQEKALKQAVGGRGHFKSSGVAWDAEQHARFGRNHREGKGLGFLEVILLLSVIYKVH